MRLYLPIRLSSTYVPSPLITGAIGAWVNVTPGAILLGPDDTAAGVGNNFGVQGVIADPSRLGYCYAPVTYQGIWESSDYGLTWAKIPITGTDPIANGRPSLRVLPNGTMISTALYPIGGVSNGFWKSTNNGRTWARAAVGAPNGDDIGGIEYLTSDPTRMIAVSHSDGGSGFQFFESRDTGATWNNQGLPGGTGAIGAGGAGDVIWLDADTLLAIGQGDNGAGPGTYRGVRSGSTWPWTWTWTSVDTQQHWHSASQITKSGANVWTGGGFGIRKSTNTGTAFTQVNATNSGSVVATPNNLYSATSYAINTGSWGPSVMKAPLPAGDTWSAMTTPGGMTNGWLYSAVLQDGIGGVVLVGGHWCAGIWRYRES